MDYLTLLIGLSKGDLISLVQRLQIYLMRFIRDRVAVLRVILLCLHDAIVQSGGRVALDGQVGTLVIVVF